MANITIDRTNRTIVITKAFDKKAQQFKSAEYNALREAMNDNEGFEVVVKSAPRRDSHKGLTFKYMEKYLEKHEKRELLAEFKLLTNNKNGNQSETYGKVKEWFLHTNPEFDEAVQKNKEAKVIILSRVKEEKAELAVEAEMAA